jgi:hypothetical protein
MNNRQILKKLEKFDELVEARKIKDAIDVIYELKARLQEEIEKEEQRSDYVKELQHLMGWYLNLWNQKPPEMFKYSVEYKSIIGKHLKDLIQIYIRNNEDIEQLKKDYENFKKSRKEWNGILQFRNHLPNIKGKPNTQEWCSPENQRGKDYYLRGWAKDDDAAW